MPRTASIQPTARRRFRPLGLMVLSAAAALTLSSCGTSAPALEDVWPEVSESIQNAKSVSVARTGTQDGQDMFANIAGQIDDSSYSGSVSMGEAHMEMIGNAEKTYIKPNGAFLEEMGGAPLQKLLGDKWLELPAKRGGFTMSTLWSSFSKDIPDADDLANSEYTSEVGEHNGEEVYKYSRTNAKVGEPSVIYITKDSKLVRVEVQQGEGASSDQPTEGVSPSPGAGPNTGTKTVDFSDWDAVEPVDMPAKDEVFAVPGM